MKKIGIFSGTFDPVHDGHISFASEALDKYGLDKIFFLPEPRPRRKQGVKALQHRVHMVQRAISRHSKMGVIVLEQARFTPHQTLPVLQARFVGADLYMLMGEDMLNHLADWPHVEELVNGVSFIVGVRKRSTKEIHDLFKILKNTRGLSFRYQVFKASNSNVSSTSTRAILRQGKEPKGVSTSVLSYIKLNNLYSISGE